MTIKYISLCISIQMSINSMACYFPQQEEKVLSFILPTLVYETTIPTLYGHYLQYQNIHCFSKFER